MLFFTDMQEAGHRRIEATLERLRAFCVWKTMDEDVREFMRDCIVRTIKRAGGLVPGPLSDTIHGTVAHEVVYFDVLHMEDSEVDEVFNSGNGYPYLYLVLTSFSALVEESNDGLYLIPIDGCIMHEQV